MAMTAMVRREELSWEATALEVGTYVNGDRSSRLRNLYLIQTLVPKTERLQRRNTSPEQALQGSIRDKFPFGLFKNTYEGY